MTGTGGATTDERIAAELAPEPALRAWVGDRLPGEGPFTIRRTTKGLSNEMFLLARSGHHWMLRRPPRTVNAKGAHDMARELRVLRALEGTAVPHARGLLLCEDPAVLGAPFYVMERVTGVGLYDGVPAALDRPGARPRIGHELVDALAELHLVDWEAAGLGDFGRPDTFTARQVARWTRQLDSYRVRDLPDLDAAGTWLEARVPTMPRATLVHGDYGLHNVMYAPSLPVELVAVVDWETATIGDPLVDLGYLLSLWLEGDEPARWTASALPYDSAGYPPRAELAARYAERTGADLAALDWYRAVGQFRVACILEGAYARHLAGRADDPSMASLRERVPNHAAYALAITRGEA